ncbi:hypothetical protein SAM23877_7603 [Streptomyces ambofaciens ATCC 23877]|uniref:Uncharacterized protein n=1 Tax=Streptomyces ambofaciens (strain ATCC 23877 / 3486 / DSM 40053 / JCM 4204 / NBRC 12836 / NRRL B-2516) TaxID=278992 RepID=A0A0K2B5U0_STRA7|nr:hypothetical protein [Streptomyces ambofaciens]AKZ60644.1 hypothetical protein SAM23877_7603 [Streptomyces ambofaciens ATCC 23877]
MIRSSKKSEPVFAQLTGAYWLNDALSCPWCTALHQSHPSPSYTPTAADSRAGST